MRILYIDIDSQRPDHLGCYGYPRDTSPAIDQIAREGLVCESVYVSDAPCMPSRTALYSGRFGIQTGVVGHGGTAGQPRPQPPRLRGFQDAFGMQGLARQLQKLGYHTAIISSFGQRHSAHWFYAGFNEIHDTGQMGMETAEDLKPVVARWLDAHARQDRWFLHVNFWDPHTPYRTPLAFGDPFAGAPLPSWLDDPRLIERHNRMVGPHTSLDLGMYRDAADPRFPRMPGRIANVADMKQLIDGYDTGVCYMDRQVGAIVAALKAARVYEDTMIIVSADHGENLGELGLYAEHATADEGTCRIPLIIRYPGGVAGGRDRALHYHLDLAPTLMDLLGGESPDLWDGRSFAATVRDGAVAGRDELVLSQCAHVCQRSVRWEQWLYLRTYHDGFHLYPREMLFNLAADPHEQCDEAPRNASVCREGAWRLARWHGLQMERLALTGGDCTDPLWTVIREGGPFHANLREANAQPGGLGGFRRYLERLAMTGREADARILEKKYAPYSRTIADAEAIRAP